MEKHPARAPLIGNWVLGALLAGLAVLLYLSVFLRLS